MVRGKNLLLDCIWALLALLLFGLMYLIFKYQAIRNFLASNPEFGSFIWGVAILIFLIILLISSKEKIRFKHGENILGGVIGGIIAGIILSFREFGAHGAIIGFLLTVIVILLLYKLKNKNQI